MIFFDNLDIFKASKEQDNYLRNNISCENSESVIPICLGYSEGPDLHNDVT